MSCIATFKKKGLKLTPQRKLILDIIHSEENLDPEGPAEFLLARNTMEGIVVNVPDPRESS